MSDEPKGGIVSTGVPIWRSAIEGKFAARAFMNRSMRDDPELFWLRADIQALDLAETYAWSTESTIATTLASRSLPTDAALERYNCADESDVQFFGCKWISFEGPLPNVLRPEESRDSGLNGQGAFLVRELYSKGAPKRLVVVRFSSGRAICRWSVDIGVSIADFRSAFERFNPQDNDAEALGHATLAEAMAVYRWLIAAEAWTNQRILVDSHRPIERHLRKQIARANPSASVDTSVRVVELRRAARQAESSIGSRSVEWSRRWIVSGHWRNQPYPSKGDKKLLFISPYVKGPSDKPLVESDRVFVVRR